MCWKHVIRPALCMGFLAALTARSAGSSSFSYDPDSFLVEVPAGGVVIETLTVRNDGASDLLFSTGIGSVDTAATRQTVEAILRANELVDKSGVEAASPAGEATMTAPVDGLSAEAIMAARSRYASASAPTVRAAVLDSWGADSYSSAIWGHLNANYGLYGQTPIVIDYSTLNHENVTYGELVASGADVLIVSDAWTGYYGWSFTAAEMAAIRRYVEEGHGLLVTAGSLNTDSVPQHTSIFAALLGMDSTRAYNCVVARQHALSTCRTAVILSSRTWLIRIWPRSTSPPRP